MKRIILVALTLLVGQSLVGVAYSKSNLDELGLIQEIIQQVRDGKLTNDHLRSLLERRNPFDQKTKLARQEETFPLKINYDLSVESLVINGKYDWKNDSITSKNFPTTRKGEADLVLELVHFNKVLTTEEALKELDKMGLRPAELRELLAFGEKYPDIQRKFPVIALGSLWRYWDGVRYVPYLDRYGDERDLFLGFGFFSRRWSGHCRFAAVRK